MAKKRTPEETSEPSAPVRRRAPVRKQAAAASASDTATVTTSAPAAENGTDGSPTQAEIAEAAYFRHLNRGGNQGDEFTDWIEAERELRQRHSR